MFESLAAVKGPTEHLSIADGPDSAKDADAKLPSLNALGAAGMPTYARARSHAPNGSERASVAALTADSLTCATVCALS